MTPLLVLDFDGTVCVGDGPVLHYARLLGGSRYAAVIAWFLREGPGSNPLLAGAFDGWEAVQALAAVDSVESQGAFLATRSAMADGRLSIAAPEGLAWFLGEARGLGAETMLVTNSPLGGMADCLRRLGIDSLLDRVVCQAHKPAGLAEVLESAPAQRDPSLVLSVGDVWHNDLEPVVALGMSSAYIDRWDIDEGPATFRADAFAELYEPVLAWVRERR